MGYTHYWTPKETTTKKWNKFVEACKILNKNLPKEIVIHSWDGIGEPEFTDKLVSFNGDADSNLDHESFVIKKDDGEWNFCKTARKPYDLLVCSCLIAAHDILGYEVNSDGDIDDWEDAIDFYLKNIYDEQPNEDEMKLVLPKFLFDDQKGNEYRKPYNLMDYIK